MFDFSFFRIVIYKSSTADEVSERYIQKDFDEVRHLIPNFLHARRSVTGRNTEVLAAQGRMSKGCVYK